MNSANPLSALEMTRLALFKMYNQAGMGGPPGPPGGPLGAAAGINQASLDMGRAMVEQQARMLQAAQQGQREAEAREKELSSKSPQMSENRLSQPKDQNNREENIGISQKRSNNSERSKESSEKSRCDEEDDMSPPPMKRERSDSFDHRNGSPLGMGANIRIANRGKKTDSQSLFRLSVVVGSHINLQLLLFILSYHLLKFDSSNFHQSIILAFIARRRKVFLVLFIPYLPDPICF
jgi:hypothetical protein